MIRLTASQMSLIFRILTRICSKRMKRTPELLTVLPLIWKVETIHRIVKIDKAESIEEEGYFQMLRNTKKEGLETRSKEWPSNRLLNRQLREKR